MSKITINGHTYEVGHNDTFVIIARKIHLNGSIVSTLERDGPITIEGDALSVESNASIVVNGNVNGNINANGSVTVKSERAEVGEIDANGSVTVTGTVNVKGDIEAGGRAEIGGNVEGNVDANGSIQISGNVTGDVDANGSVTINGVKQKKW